MRVENHTIGSIMHIVKRGARGIDITADLSDRVRFKRLLFYVNDLYQDNNFGTAIDTLEFFERPKTWPDREPLVNILAWTLVPNHFHLILEEIRDSGIAKFMQRLCGSMSSHSNAKYKTSGSLFQGAYRGKVITTDSYLRQVFCYVIIKNVFELHPRGLNYAIKNFDAVWRWALKYKSSSFADSVLKTGSPILTEHELFKDISDSKKFKKEALELLKIHQNFAELEK